MIPIKPTQIPLRNAEANFISMRSEFDLGAETSRVFWQLFDAEQKAITSGTVEIDSKTHFSWVENDSVIENYVINQLNLKKL